jgi:hypothetical protein
MAGVHTRFTRVAAGRLGSVALTWDGRAECSRTGLSAHYCYGPAEGRILEALPA